MTAKQPEKTADTKKLIAAKHTVQRTVILTGLNATMVSFTFWCQLTSPLLYLLIIFPEGNISTTIGWITITYYINIPGW